MSEYRESRRDVSVADEAMKSYMACGFCGKQTLKSTLSEYGGRCFGCFEAYCSQGKHYSDADKTEIVAKLRALCSNFGAPANPQEWAYQLQSREFSGEKLSRVQRAAWRNVIGDQE